MKRLFYTILVIISSSGGIFGQTLEQFSDKAKTKNYFIENKGQWDNNILFLAQSNGMKVWVTTDALVFDFYIIESSARSENSHPENPKDIRDSSSIKGHVVKMKIALHDQNSFEKQEIVPGKVLEQYNNYFIGNDPNRWISYVSLFSSVLIKNYVPGVDLKLYFDQGKFRYDLISQPGINPDNISLEFEGQDALQINELQELILKTSIGDISHSDLEIFQEIDGKKISINSGFTKTSVQNIGFQINTYNPFYPVVIDPLVYSTFLGGNDDDWGYDVDIDGSGNAVVGGVTSSSNFPTTSGAYRRTFFGYYDIFVSKFNSNGSALTYSTYIGGSNSDNLTAIKLDASGNCYLTGNTYSSNYPIISGAYQSSMNNTNYSDIMVTKLNSSGTALIYSTYLGGSTQDYATDIDLDSINNAYICGYSLSSNYPTTSSGFQRTLQGSYDGIITKLNSSGSDLIYSTYLGGSSGDECNGIYVDDSGYAYITGSTHSSNFPRTTACFQNFLTGGEDAFVTKINTSGSALCYSTLLGGNSYDYGTSIFVDNSGYAAIAGCTGSSNFPTTSGAYATTRISSNEEAFVTKLNTSGTALSYSTYFGGNNEDRPSHIIIDQNNNMIISGTTYSSNLPTTICAIQTTKSGMSDIFLSVFNPTLSSLIFSTLFGGNSIELSTGFVINTNDEAYLTGYTVSTNFPTTTGAFQGTRASYIDAFLVKLQYLYTILGMSGTIQNSFCAGTSFSMPFTAGCLFSTGNIFNIQLSNSSGSFSSPVTIGSVNRQVSGTVNCTIPKNIVYGTGYRIRLVSTKPSYTSNDNGYNITIIPAPSVKFAINNPTQCLGNNYFQFTDSSTSPSGSLTRFWKFGDTTFSSQTNPSHNYLNDTNYTVKLIVTTDSGCRDSLSKVVTINPSPETNFSVYDSFQCLENNLFSFFSSTSLARGKYTVLWNFGDGDTSTNRNPGHSYKSNSNFVVKLTAITDKGCRDSAFKTMKILPSPQSGFSVNDSIQCINTNNFSFTNVSSITKGTLTYKWHFGDGATSAAVSPSHIYTAVGDFSTELIAISDSGCIDTAKQQISLMPMPVAGFTINSSPQCFNGNTFYFTNKSTISSGSVKSKWDFGNGVSDTIKNPVYSYSSDGTFNISLVATSLAGCVDTISRLIVIHPSPISSFSINDSDQCFNGNNFIFANSSTIKTGNLTHLWNFGDATTASSTNGTHSYGTDKNYTVKLISLSDRGCKDSITKIIQIYPSPKSKYIVNDSDQCVNKNSFSFTNASNIKNGTLKYQWLYGDSKSDTLKNPVHVYSNNGNYNVKLIAISNKNCSDTFSRLIYVYPLPIADFTTNNLSQCLKGNNFIFNNTSTIPSGSMTYRWFFGDGFQSTITSPTHIYYLPKTFDVMLIANSSFGCADTAISKVTVHIMPKANYTVSTICLNEPFAFSDRSFINNPDSITQWIWDFGDGSAGSSDQNPSCTYSNSGTYGVRLIVVSNNGCKDSVIKPVFVRSHVSAPEIDRVSVRNGIYDIEIEWSPPGSGYVKDYVLEKSLDNLSFTTLSYPDRQTTKYIDFSVLPDSMSYYYRIKAIDSCDFTSDNSNYGKSILLHTTNNVHLAELNWTAYEEWAEGIDHYEIELYDNKTSGFMNVGTVNANTLEFFDDITALNQLDYCYRVAAIRNGDGAAAYSNSDCVPVSFSCFIPNSFTPNGDTLNEVLKAIGTSVFKFSLSIYDRWGNLLFSSNDMNFGWDGTYYGGKVPAGYYYYQMSARGIKNQKVSRTGTILLIR